MEQQLRPPQDARSSDQAAAKNPNTKLWIFSALLVTALVLVLLVLPKMVAGPELKPQQESQLAPAEIPEKNSQSTPQENPTPPAAEAGIDNQTRINAEQALQSFLRLQAQPQLGNAEIWAADSWAEAMASAVSGDKALARVQFTKAVNQYQLGIAQLQTILDNRDDILLQYLTSGWKFLTDNALEDARSAFNSVLTMEADHQQAQLGLQQTAARVQVLELMQAGKQAEITDDLAIAAEAYSAALQLDAHYYAAGEGLKRVTLELQRRAFSDAMGQALKNLDQGKFRAAEKALQQAVVISPDDPSINATRQRLAEARRKAGLGSLRRQSTQQQAQEDWSGAAKSYRQALAIDPRAAFASSGLKRAEQKIKLHQQIDHYLTDPTRLYSSEPLDNARKLLVANQNPPAAEVKLAKKIQSLENVVRLAATPVDLLVVSDSQTDVTIYKVGRQGKFAQKQFKLLPGKYTLVGARKGYRDVHQVIELKPRLSGQQISVISEEKF